MKFKFLHRVPGGHKFFKCPDERIAIADDSGDWPDQTDDGVLYVNLHKTPTPSRDGSYWNMHLIDNKGEACSSPIGYKELLFLLALQGAITIHSDEVRELIGMTTRQRRQNG